MKKYMCLIMAFFFGYVMFHTEMASAKQREKTSEIIVSYDLDGGYNSILNPENIRIEDLPLRLENPRKEGYSFGGWYTNDSFEERVYDIKENGSYNFFAKWNLNIEPNRNVQDYPYKNNGKEYLLKELSYDFLYAVDTPGNPKTRVDDLLDDKFASEYQCPQGFCITPDYYIVSSYALENGKLGALTLYKRESGEYVVSLGMEASSHLGGIAFDGKNLWVCHSKTKELECISYEFIKKIAAVSNKNFIDISGCFVKYKVDNVPSCITCKDNKLFVVTHRIYTPGVLYCYELSENLLLLKEKFLVPPKVQGIYIDESEGVWLSQSYGRNRSSHLSFFQNLKHLKKEFLVPDISVEMPPGSEAIVVEDGICYVIFETSSYKYYEGSDGKGTCRYPIDKILMINQDSIQYD